MKRIETNGKTIELIGVDLGYGNIKTATTVTRTGIIEHNGTPPFSDNVLYVDGRYFCIGEGHKPFIADKTEDDDFYHLALVAIARELSDRCITKANVHIITSLPVKWVSSQKENLTKKLTSRKHVDFTYDGIHYEIDINGCTVFPQGYTAVYDKLSGMSGKSVIADIGNGTMNVITIESTIENKRVIESECYTEMIGVEQLVIRAKNKVFEEFYVNIGSTTIERYICDGIADIDEKYQDCIAEVARNYCKEIFDTLRKYNYDAGLMKLYIVGGGACIVRNFGTFDKKRVTINGDVKAAVKGAEAFAIHMIEKGKMTI